MLVGKIDTLEIDFIAHRLEERIYLQVSFRIEAEKTRNREMAPLLRVSDHFPKYIITLDDFMTGITPEGINIVHLRDFLFMESL